MDPVVLQLHENGEFIGDVLSRHDPSVTSFLLAVGVHLGEGQRFRIRARAISGAISWPSVRALSLCCVALKTGVFDCHVGVPV